MPSKLCILENRLKWLLAIIFGGLQRMGLLRMREKIVYWCILLFLSSFLSSFYHFLSFFLSILVTLSFWLLSCHELFFSLGYFPFWSLSPWVLSTLLQWVPLPSSMTTSLFYSELIQWDFSLLPLGLHQLFLVCCGHSFKTTHQPISCPTTTTA